MHKRFSQEYVTAKLVHSMLRVFVRPPSELHSIPGYLHPLEARFLYWLAGKVPTGGLAVEIGSFKGKSSAFLAAGLASRGRLACVDTWRNDAMPYDAPSDSLSEFLANTKPYHGSIETHRGTSIHVASSWTRPIDLLFIDGDHSYEGCSTDIKAWLRFVRRGGWVAFHDSSEQGVIHAMSELFPPGRRRTERYAWSIFAARIR
jgi:predicted O-methyltransferase YrrM